MIAIDSVSPFGLILTKSRSKAPRAAAAFEASFNTEFRIDLTTLEMMNFAVAGFVKAIIDANAASCAR